MQSQFTFRVFIAALLLGPLYQAQAQISRLDDDAQIVQQQGKLFTMTLNPKDRLVKISVAGKDFVAVDPTKLKVVGHTYDLQGKRKEIHLTQKSDSAFQITEPVEDQSKLEVSVEDRRDPSKKENLELKLKPKK